MNADPLLSIILKCHYLHIVKICCSFAIICHSLSQHSRLSAVTSACATLFTFLDILADSKELLSGEELSAVIWKRSLCTLSGQMFWPSMHRDTIPLCAVACLLLTCLML